MNKCMPIGEQEKERFHIEEEVGGGKRIGLAIIY